MRVQGLGLVYAVDDYELHLLVPALSEFLEGVVVHLALKRPAYKDSLNPETPKPLNPKPLDP